MRELIKELGTPGDSHAGCACFKVAPRLHSDTGVGAFVLCCLRMSRAICKDKRLRIIIVIISTEALKM